MVSVKTKTLSELSVRTNGRKIGPTDLVVPKQFYERILAGFPKAREEAESFFASHKKSKAIVFVDFDGE